MHRTAFIILAAAPVIALRPGVRERQAPQAPPICRAPAPTAGFATRDSAGIQIVESWTPVWRDAAASVRIAAQPTIAIGETSREAAPYQFGRMVSATRLSTGEIVVADGQATEIRVFDSGGRHVRSFGRRGQGPGEYMGLARVLRLAGDTLLAVDPRRLTYLRPDGSVIRTIAVAGVPFNIAPASPGGRATRGSVYPQVLGRHADGSYMASHNVMHRGESRTHVRRMTRIVARVHADGTKTDSVFATHGPELLVYLSADGGITEYTLPWASIGSYAPGARGFFESLGERYEVHERNALGATLRIIRLCRPPAVATAADIAAARKRLSDVEVNAEERAKVEVALSWPPAPKTLPAFTQLLVDASARLWARDYTKADGVQSWHVFDPAGRYLGPVTVPLRHEVLEIGRDYLLAKAVDADGVESVRVYALVVGARGQ